ncbi:MAG: prepilin-type N-terminal cleavage/methylation domain-containing protein [Desulfobacteraceae bacterium]|nr:MAG: prepilin-type N-terminal cleavage/methylation domain-containing protein [Desulfobacteraceae bacterium]
MKPSGLPAKPGFTLFELLIVIILLGMFGSLLFTRIADVIAEGDLRSAARMVIGEIQRYRAQAVHSRSDQFLAVDMIKNSLYGMNSQGESLSDVERTSGRQEKHLPSGVRLEDVVIHPQGKIQESAAVIRFYADGSMERALIHLRNEADEVYTLQLNPFTGAVKVYETYVDEREG